MAQGPQRQVDEIVEGIHEALFGEHYTGQAELHAAIVAGIKQAMLLTSKWSYEHHTCNFFPQPDRCLKCAFHAIGALTPRETK
jgi:hypothetical protein